MRAGIQPGLSVAVIEPIAVTFDVAAQMVGVSPWMVFKWVRDGRLNAIQVASDRRILVDELNDFIRNRAANPPRAGRPPKWPKLHTEG